MEDFVVAKGTTLIAAVVVGELVEILSEFVIVVVVVLAAVEAGATVSVC